MSPQNPIPPVSIVVKSNYNSDLRRFTWQISRTFESLLELLSNLYKKSINSIVVKYIDDEGDKIIVGSTQEFLDAINFALASVPPLLRLLIEDGRQPILVIPKSLESSWVLVPSDSVTSPRTINVNSSVTGSRTWGKGIKASQLPTWGKKSSPTNSGSSVTSSSTTASPEDLASAMEQISPLAVPTATASAPALSCDSSFVLPASTALPILSSKLQPIPGARGETLKESILRASEQVQNNLLNTNSEIRSLIMFASNQQHASSLANSPPASCTASIAESCRAWGSAINADCQKESDQTARNLVHNRPISCPDLDGNDNSWESSVLSSSLAFNRSTAADCISAADAIFEKLRNA